jgi:hypothetical protein
VDTAPSLAAAVARFLGDGGSLTAQLSAMQALRAKDGRPLSDANRARIGEMLTAVESLRGDLSDLKALAVPDPADVDAVESNLEALIEEARWMGVLVESPSQTH